MPETAQPKSRTSPAGLLQQAQEAVQLAKRVGANEAVAAVSRRRGLEFRWRDGKLENVKEDATRGLSIALYVDGRYSTHATNDLDPQRLETFLREAVALARHLEPDPFRRIPDAELYAGRAEVDLDLVDPEVADLAREVRLDWCRSMNDRAGDHASVISSTTQVLDDHSMVGRASSNGFAGTHEQTTILYGAAVTIRDGEKRPEDHYFVGGTHRDGLPAPDAVGAEALARVLSRVGAKKVESRKTAMIVHPEAGAALLGRLVGALSAGAIQQKRSYLADRLGKRISAPVLTMTDDPLIPRGLASELWDGEGIASRARPVIEDGVLRNYYVDTYYGRKLGWDPTTGGASNLVFRHGDLNLEETLASVGDGILVTSWLGGNANLTSGDYSFGVRGHVVEGGVIGEPIAEMNVTGNYDDLLGRLVAVGNDPVPWYACQTPTLVFDDVEFSGR